MTYSLNETGFMATKAARGAGYPWGVAREAGRATRWLIERDIDGCAVLASLLNALDRADPDQWRQCPITRGLSLADMPSILRDEPQKFAGIAEPLMIIPFAADAARKLAQALRITGCFGTAYTDGLWLAIELQSNSISGSKSSLDDIEIALAPASLRLREPRPPTEISSEARALPPVDQPSGHTRPDPIIPRKICTRARPDSKAWAALNILADKTYAPATEQSRLRGAGAGLSDND